MGDVLVYDNYMLARSGTNTTNTDRRALFGIYNAERDGDYHDRYYQREAKGRIAAGFLSKMTLLRSRYVHGRPDYTAHAPAQFTAKACIWHTGRCVAASSFATAGARVGCCRHPWRRRPKRPWWCVRSQLGCRPTRWLRRDQGSRGGQEPPEHIRGGSPRTRPVRAVADEDIRRAPGIWRTVEPCLRARQRPARARTSAQTQCAPHPKGC